MNEIYYLKCIVIAFILSFMLLAFFSSKKGYEKKVLLFILLFSPFLMLFSGQIFYYFSRYSFITKQEGLRFFLSYNVGCFSAFGCISGGVICLLLCAYFLQKPFKQLLNDFFPFLVLLLAFTRFSEFFVSFGTGDYVEQTSMQFFPYAIINEYEEWYEAIFMMEGIVALLIFLLISNIKNTKDNKAWYMIVLVCLTQIYFESRRAECLRLGFVRITQILCLITCLSLHSITLKKMFENTQSKKAISSIILCILCVCALIFVEFALDKTNLPSWLLYTFMVGTLALLFVHMDKTKKI